MLAEQTLRKLSEMKLTGMAEAYEEQCRQSATVELSFDDRLAMLVDRQWLWKENRALAARLVSAQLKQPASIEDLDYRSARGLPRALTEQLARCDWIRYHQNCIVTGATGTGKTFVACALAQKGCREGFRCLYFYAPKLFRQLTLAHADGSLSTLLKKLARADLLLVDDWGLPKLDEARCRDFLEILDDRHGSASTLLTSQFPVASWHELVPDPTVADAILDRLVHNSIRIELAGESMRKPKQQR